MFYVWQYQSTQKADSSSYAPDGEFHAEGVRAAPSADRKRQATKPAVNPHGRTFKIFYLAIGEVRRLSRLQQNPSKHKSAVLPLGPWPFLAYAMWAGPDTPPRYPYRHSGTRRAESFHHLESISCGTVMLRQKTSPNAVRMKTKLVLYSCQERIPGSPGPDILDKSSLVAALKRCKE